MGGSLLGVEPRFVHRQDLQSVPIERLRNMSTA
jgi:hypothetical protein